MPTLDDILADCECDLPDFYDSEDYNPDEDFPDEDSWEYLLGGDDE